MLRNPFLVALALALTLPVLGDQVITKDRKRYTGRIVSENESEVRILTYKDGEIAIPRSQIERVNKGRSKFDSYDKQLAKANPKTAQEQFDFGLWCKKTGLPTMARRHWELAVEADPDFEPARKALGHQKVDGKWMSEEDFYEAKGWVRYEGRWMPPEEAKRKRNAKLAKQVKERIQVTVTFQPNAPKGQMEEFGEKIRFWAGIIWDMTGGAVYIDKVDISDQDDTGNCVVESLDRFNLRNGNSGQAKIGSKKFIVGGKTHGFVWVHEFYHAYASLPDHYGTTIPCIMNSSERSRIFQWKFCDGCWARVQKVWNLPFRPGFVPDKELEGIGCPGTHGSPQDYGDPPEIAVTVTDR